MPQKPDLAENGVDIHLKPYGACLFGQEKPKEIRNKIILIESQTGNSITYGQLEDQAHSLARAMLSLLNLGPDDICAILSESSIQYAVTISACLILNITYTSVVQANGPYNLANQLIQTGAKYLFVSKNLCSIVQKMFNNEKFSHLKNQVKIVLMNNNPSDALDLDAYSTVQKLISAFQGEQNRITPVPYYQKSLDDILTIVFTSGSTGKPKGACHTHRSLMTNTMHFKDLKPLAQNRHLKMLLSFPLSHISGNCILFFTLMTRIPVVLLNYEDIPKIFQVISKYQIGQIYGSSNVLNLLAKQQDNQDHDLSSVKLTLTSGCKLSSNTANVLFKKYGIKIVESYGSTECLFVSANEDCDRIPENVGKVLSCTEVKIIDIDNGKTLSFGQTGEICLRGPSLFREYYKNPEETNRAKDSDGWFHTGDLGHLDIEGNLTITDRIKAIIKFKGWSVYPADIECFLLTHEAVLGAVVVPVKHINYNQAPRAYVVLKDGLKITVEQLNQYVNDNLGFQQRIRGGIILVDQLKYTAMGKVDRQYYQKLCQDEVLHFIED